MTDTLQRFIFKDTPVRGEIVRLDQSLKTIIQQHAFPDEISNLLSQTLCATTLLSAILKYDGQLTIQFQSDGPLNMLVAKCDNQYRIRGTAQWDTESLPGSLEHDFQDGSLVITIQENNTNKHYQSIVDIDHQSISQSLESYFIQSEQIETKIWLAYDAKTQEAAGLLLQKLPGESLDESLELANDSDESWQHIQILANTLTEHELLNWSNQELLSKLFADETIQLFDADSVKFYCPCDVEKMLNAVSVLGEEEALKLLSTNRYIDVTCEYCKNRFEFSADEVKRLFTRH